MPEEKNIFGNMVRDGVRVQVDNFLCVEESHVNNCLRNIHNRSYKYGVPPLASRAHKFPQINVKCYWKQSENPGNRPPDVYKTIEILIVCVHYP